MIVAATDATIADREVIAVTVDAATGKEAEHLAGRAANAAKELRKKEAQSKLC